MNNQPNAFFFEIQPIPEDTILFDQFKTQTISFSYFQVDQNYYLFFYSQKSIDIDSIDPFIHILEELDTKQRKLRSLRGFFLYALEIMNNEKDLQILKTNLKPSFWRNLRTILRQNKKIVLLQFLFGRGYTYQDSSSHLEDQIQTLKNQVNSLQQKIIELEQNQTLNFKKALSELLKRSEAAKIDQQDNTNLKSEHSANLLENENEVNLEVQEPSKTVSEAKIKRVTPLSNNQPEVSYTSTERSEEYNLASNPNQSQNEHNFMTLGKIPEEEKIEIIKLGFQLQSEDKIALKNYYQSTDQNSLFQLKAYSLKYESIRKTKLYQDLKKKYLEK